MSMLGSNAFRMELHTVNGKRLVHKSHHKPVGGFGIYFQGGGHACPFDHERMIPCCFQWTVDAAKDSRAGMLDLRHLAVDRRCPHNLAAEGLTDGLMAKTDAEDWNGQRCFLDQLETDAGLI